LTSCRNLLNHWHPDHILTVGTLYPKILTKRETGGYAYVYQLFWVSASCLKWNGWHGEYYPTEATGRRLLWISDVCQYIFYFLLFPFTSRKTQHNTYQNSYSEFILNFLDIIYSQITPFFKQLYLLQLEPLVFPDYALFSNHNHGYASLSKRLWLCVKVCGSL
jgi:hypothetical protein